MAFLGIILELVWFVFLVGVETREIGPLGWWSSERLGWVLAGDLWWVLGGGLGFNFIMGGGLVVDAIVVLGL